LSVAATASALPILYEKIAFASDRDGNSEIYVMDPDGTNLVKLTDNTAVDQSPVWSPDGTKIAFYSDRDGDNEIYVMNADGTGLTQVTNNSGNDYGPSWSPDGNRIVFQSAPNIPTQTDIWVMNASDGSGLTELSNNLGGDGPDWSPDGTTIAFSSIRDGNNNIWVMNVNGTNPILLPNGVQHEGGPKWSPNGMEIVFTATPPGGNADIYVMDASGANVIQLTTDGALGQSPPLDDANPSWSPDGTKIVFSSHRDGNYDIFVMNANGTGQMRVNNNTVGSYGDLQPSWGLTPINLTETPIPPSTPIPEPSSILLLGVGIIGIALYGYRRRKKAA
ncbi:PD40 domain-containing protein, partial [Candidatus Poribacteria bacterium]|nr:PD40 domain-containing protein [Candidatus Poribacteria bacterium]